MTGGLTVLLLYGEWIVNEYRLWIFQATKSYGLKLSSRTRYEELLKIVENKLGVDVTTQRVHLSYCWPQFMLMDDGKDAPPIPIRIDEDVDCFLSVRANIDQINLYATITEISPNCHEVVESNSLSNSIMSGVVADENYGAIVVYEDLVTRISTDETDYEMFAGPVISDENSVLNLGNTDINEETIHEVQNTYNDKGKGKVGENVMGGSINQNTSMNVTIIPHIPPGFEIGEGSNRQRVDAQTPWQTLFEELERFNHLSNINNLEVVDPNSIDPVINTPLEVPIFHDEGVQRDVDPNTRMGSAMGNVEMLIAEEFDPVEEFVCGSPGDTENEGSPHVGTEKMLSVGRLFKDKSDFRLQVSINAITNKYTFKTLRSSPKLIEVVCISPECPWRVFSTIVDGGTQFEVRSAVLDHCCSVDDRRHYHRHATVDVLGELMMARFVGGRRGPCPVEIQRLVHVEYQVRITYWNAWKCREIAMEKAVGSIIGSYAMLPSYLSNLVDKNPGSICKLECEDDVTGGKRFKYLFISYGASIQGLPFLRPVILVDGTHLKGRYGGCLLIASGQDGNFQTFPIAYGVVDSENDAAYEWFFKCLHEVVGDHRHLVFISDRHASINKGLEKVYPQSGHGACLVHLTRNVATKFSRQKRLPGLVIRAGKAYTVFECALAMAEIEAISPACGEYLRDVGLTRWTRAYFIGDRYNLMNTNLAESLNNVLKECRGLPIIAMLEAIRMSLHKWFDRRRCLSQKDTHSLTPRVRAMLEPIFDESHYMTIYRINEGEYEVHDRAGGKFFVNLKNRSCSCRFWDVEMIPCPHAMAAGHKEDMVSEDMISEKYYQQYLQHTWAEGIYPFRAPIVTQPRVLPPWTRRPPGRPKKERFKSRVEMKDPTVKESVQGAKGLTTTKQHVRGQYAIMLRINQL